MSTRKEFLLTQLRSCRNQDGWFPPLSVALRGLTAEQASKNVGQSTNSIFGIINHLIFWNERYLHRFNDRPLPALKMTNADTFVKDSNEIVSWDDLQQRLDNIFAEWEEAIIKCDDAKLDSRIHPDKDDSWWASLAHLVIHNAHHIGQIVHIRKDQGLWETWFELEGNN